MIFRRGSIVGRTGPIQAFKRIRQGHFPGAALVMGLGPGEIILIILAILLLFGGRKIPELMRSLGEGVREFKKASKGLTEEETRAPGPKSDSEKLRDAASALGIATEGKSDEELRAEISAKMGK